MKSLRALQRYAGAQQLLKARPATSNVASQSRAPLQQTFRTRPVVQHKAPNSPLFRLIHTQRSTFSSPSQTLRSLRRARKSNGRRHNSSAAPEAQPLSLKDRLKKMSREYGWTAVGVYLALSALDFPFCFMAVRLIGTEKIGHYEHVVVESVKGFLKWPIQGSQMETLLEEAVDEGAGGKEVQKVEREGTRRILEEKGEQDVKVEGVFDHGYRDAVKANRGDNASEYLHPKFPGL